MKTKQKISTAIDMENISKELRIPNKNIFATASNNLFTVVVHSAWLKKLLKNTEVDSSVNNVDFTLSVGESVPYPYRKIFIRVLSKKVSKALPLPRYKLSDGNIESPLTFPQLLQYVSQSNHRNLWRESYKKYFRNSESNKESSIVNLTEHDQLMSEVIFRLYGCNIIKIKSDANGKVLEYKEIVPNRYVSKCYETQANLLAAMFALETDTNFYIIYNGHYENNLLDCLNFSPNLIDINYTRGLFIIYQLLNVSKAMGDRGLSLGTLTLQDIFLSENLWLQVAPAVINNVHSPDASLIHEQSRSKPHAVSVAAEGRSEEWCWRNDAVELEKLCMLWVRGRISNLDYLLHLNMLVGRRANDPQAYYIVPWVTDFSSRCGRNWRDLTKSKYRLTKGDRQLDMTYDVAPQDEECLQPIPHHVSDPLSDITCYVYLARRTPKEVLCKYVRNKWVPAEYPGSIQRMQEWTPDECIPEFYTDPLAFKSIHEDLPDLGIPSWATCVEDFITKHREALESSHVSENLHHWIDLTFGYKMTGAASVKCKNVSLSLVDGHMCVRPGAAVQLLSAPHPARRARPPPAAPPRLHWTQPNPAHASSTKKPMKGNDSSDGVSDEDDESSILPHHVSRLNIPTQHVRSRHKSATRARSLSKAQDADGATTTTETRASSHSRHYRVQRSELGKGIIYLPKEYNPIASIQALESLDNFRTKCFFSKSEDVIKRLDESIAPIKMCASEQETKQSDIKTQGNSDQNSFTNHMFLASYEQNYLRKFSHDAHLEHVLKERKSRAFATRYTTDASVYKQFVAESRREDMLVIGCLIVEIFLHNYMRPLRLSSSTFLERYNICRTVFKYNFHSMPKCVSYVASLLLNVEPPKLSSNTELSSTKSAERVDIIKKIVVTEKGLPSPTASQLLQPLLMQHLIPFPQSFGVLYKLLMTLHEYELTINELNILYMYECDGTNCDEYQNIDKTKLYFTQRIAEGKVRACATHLDTLLSQLTSFNQFDVLDIFLAHYIELLEDSNTAVLAAWYLFDTVSKALGPAESRKKLLKHILNLYDDDSLIAVKPDQNKSMDSDAANSLSGSMICKQKFVKLYHNIFLLQLMVRLGLRCFLDNFTQHLVEAVGGYKDVDNCVGSPGHLCRDRATVNKKPRYSDDTVKNALTTTSDIFSPDTSYGSEQLITPVVEKVIVDSESFKDTDNRSENDLFHFETDKESRLHGSGTRSKSPTESLDSYTLNAPHEANPALTPSPTSDVSSQTSKECSPNVRLSTVKMSATQLLSPTLGATSPTIDIPKSAMFTSYLHFAEDDERTATNEEAESRNINQARRTCKSLELGVTMSKAIPSTSKSFNEEEILEPTCEGSNGYMISDMASESILWLSHRLGPVLTCRYVTRNLLKMLTLCYIGKENLVPLENDSEGDDFDAISIASSKVVGDRNAMKVIKCLTSIVGMYGEQLILFQYLPHMGELIASCRRRLSAPLEGGVVACLQLLKYLLPLMSDVKLMEQLQDTFLKSIVHPSVRLLSTTRCTFPHGARARAALARKLLDAVHSLAVRVGPEMTRKHLCVPALQRFFLTFDKATGKTENWPKSDVDPYADKGTSSLQETGELKAEGFLEICRDGTTAEWTVRDGLVVREDVPPDLACSPPDNNGDCTRLTAQEELLMVFNEQLAHQAYVPFMRFVGSETMERSLKNNDTIQSLCLSYDRHHVTSPPCNILHDNRIQSSFSEEGLCKRIDVAHSSQVSDVAMDHMSSTNSFGSNVTLVGNRIDVSSDAIGDLSCRLQKNPLDVVSYKVDNGVKSNRHLRGDWLIYWEHEIGRPDKENRFNLKQIKLQQFVGHTQSVKSIYCMDNECNFMSGSKDKTVRLWSLRNQGDGGATTQCNWTYTGHKKGVLSLTFLESLRLAVSTDSVVHIWDPFMESVVSQLDNVKSAVSIVRTLPGPSTVVVAATTDATIKMIDARCCNYTHDLKLPSSANTSVRCMCVSPCGRWVACGLASGHVAVLETRTGRPMAAWRAHEGEVLRVAAAGGRALVSSGLDQAVALWAVQDGERMAHLKGATEPVHCLSVQGRELISGTTNNRILVHTALSADASHTSTRLRSDTLRGVLTCLAALPRHRLLLLGQDAGAITLIC